ncbi:MAG: hypothetical protein WAR76_00785 [Xanthobacteraceae bacterium]|jgi:hypothetical protein
MSKPLLNVPLQSAASGTPVDLGTLGLSLSLTALGLSGSKHGREIWLKTQARSDEITPSSRPA